MKIKLSEEQIHTQICKYLKIFYPDIIFNTDMSGIKLTTGQAAKAKKLRSSNGFPDIVIYEYGEAVKCRGLYKALFLEVKKETPYKANGELKKMTRRETINGIKVSYDHLQRQNEMHIKLRERGYKAEFVWSFDMAKQIIDDYLYTHK